MTGRGALSVAPLVALALLVAAPALAADPPPLGGDPAPDGGPVVGPGDAPAPDAAPTPPLMTGRLQEAPEPESKTRARQLLDAANLLLLEREPGAAKAVLEALVRRHPDSPEVGKAQLLLAMIHEETGEYSLEEEARVALILGDTLTAALYGSLLYAGLTDDFDSGVYWTAFGSGLAGLGASLYMVHLGLTQAGFVEAHLGIQLLATSFTLETGLALEVDGDDLVVAASLVGLGAALTTALLYEPLQMPKGRSRFFVAAGGWGQFFGLLGWLMADGGEALNRKGVLVIPAAGLVSAVAGGWLWPGWRASRTSFVSLGGALGALLGGGIALSLKGDTVRAGSAMLAGGALIGLGTTIYFTRNMAPDPSVAGGPGGEAVTARPAVLTLPDARGRLRPALGLQGSF